MSYRSVISGGREEEYIVGIKGGFLSREPSRCWEKESSFRVVWSKLGLWGIILRVCRGNGWCGWMARWVRGGF